MLGHMSRKTITTDNPLVSCAVCALPNGVLKRINNQLVVDRADPAALADELGIPPGSVIRHFRTCLDMDKAAARIFQQESQRLELDPAAVVSLFAESIQSAAAAAKKLEDNDQWDKAGKMHLGVAAQAGRFIETIMERQERKDLQDKVDRALAQPPGLTVTGEQPANAPARRAKSAAQIIAELGPDGIEEAERAE